MTKTDKTERFTAVLEAKSQSTLYPTKWLQRIRSYKSVQQMVRHRVGPPLVCQPGDRLERSLQAAQNMRNVTTISCASIRATCNGGVIIEACMGWRTVSGRPWLDIFLYGGRALMQ